MRDGSASEMAPGERGRAQVVGLAADGSRVESCPYPLSLGPGWPQPLVA